MEQVALSGGQSGSECVEYSNALMQNRNAIIKLVTKATNDYRCWERFRNRCMLVLEKGIDFERLYKNSWGLDTL